MCCSSLHSNRQEQPQHLCGYKQKAMQEHQTIDMLGGAEFEKVCQHHANKKLNFYPKQVKDFPSNEKENIAPCQMCREIERIKHSHQCPNSRENSGNKYHLNESFGQGMTYTQQPRTSSSACQYTRNQSCQNWHDAPRQNLEPIQSVESQNSNG